MNVCLLIANYNNRPYIIECFKSVLAQTYNNWNVIILDDCSTDDSVKVVSEFIEHDKRFKLITENVNRGVGYAKKKLAEIAQGEVAAFLDPDDVLLPCALEVIVKSLKDNPELIAAFTGYSICDHKLENCERITRFPFGIRERFSFWEMGITGSLHPLFGFRLAAYKKTEGINAEYRIGEDLDLYFKLDEVGPVLSIEENGYLVRRHDRSLTASINPCKPWPWVMKVLYATGKRRVGNNIFSYSQYGKLILERWIFCLRECKYYNDRQTHKNLRLSFFTEPFNGRLFIMPVFYKYILRHIKAFFFKFSVRIILLYHIYPINHWKEVTDILFQKLLFDKIVVHVSLPGDDEEIKKELQNFFSNYPVHNILYSPNSGTGEVDAMKSFVSSVNLQGFDMLTYMHCKGVTKPENENILEWTRLMRYFIIEKMDACKNAFKKGYVTYGINKSIPDQKDEGFRGSNFYYAGNFVSLNLRKVDLKTAVAEHIEHTYYGLEGFWGKLCSYKDGFSIFNSGINHYLMTLPQKDYTTAFGRFRYSMVRRFYQIKSLLEAKGDRLK